MHIKHNINIDGTEPGGMALISDDCTAIQRKLRMEKWADGNALKSFSSVYCT